MVDCRVASHAILTSPPITLKSRCSLNGSLRAASRKHNEIGMKDRKEKTIRGGLARLAAQGANFLLRTVPSRCWRARSIAKDFGLGGTETAFTGVLSMLRDFGLSSAAI